MNKSIIWGILILIALFAFLIWRGFLQLPNQTTLVEKAIPKNAIAVLQMPAYRQLLKKMDDAIYYNDLNKVEWVKAINNTNTLLNQLFDGEPIDVSNQKLIACLHLNKNKALELLYILPIKKYDSKPFQYFRKAFVSEKDKVQPQSYKGTTIYKAQTSITDFREIAFAECEGLLLFSQSTSLVEQSINSIKAGESHPNFKNIQQKLLSKTPQLGLHLNFGNLNTAQFSANDEKANSIIKQWVKQDLILNGGVFATNSKLVFNGKVEHNNLFINNLIKNASSNSFKLRTLIPENVSGFQWFGVNNLYAFLEMYMEQEDVEEAEDLLNLSEGLGNEWLINWHNDVATERSFILSLTDLEKVATTLSTDFDLKDVSDIRVLKQQAIVHFINQSKTKSDYYYTFFNDHLIIADSKKRVKQVLDDLKTGKTLNQSQAFIDFESNILSNAISIAFIKNDRIKSIVNDSSLNLNQTQKKALQQFYPAILQWYPAKEQLFLNATLAYEGKGLTEKINLDFDTPPLLKNIFTKKEESTKASKWKKIIGEKLVSGPHSFLNHYTGENENIVQDLNQTLYLINPKDSILWKKKLDGAILGKTHSIDFYNNNKLQILLNTENSLYLIDRKGKTVSGFPKRFSELVSNPISMVHYKDVNKTRYFAVSKNGKLFGFTKDGSSLKGWNFKGSLGEVNQPLLHFINNKKDYLCIVNEVGVVYFFSRNGTLRTEQPISLNIENIKQLSTKEGTDGEKYLHITYGKNKTIGVKVDGTIL